jgi:hypothetical protein
MTDPQLASIVGLRVVAAGVQFAIGYKISIRDVAVELGAPFLKGPLVRFPSDLHDRSRKFAAATRRRGEA